MWEIYFHPGVCSFARGFCAYTRGFQVINLFVSHLSDQKTKMIVLYVFIYTN